MRSFEKEKFTYKVQHLYVMKVPDQEYYSYSMVIGRLYNGMVVDTSSDFLLAVEKVIHIQLRKSHYGDYVS